MTLPVCPACRSDIALDAHSCDRCGLAVRPTCQNCGEALEPWMHTCPRCWEPIAEPTPPVTEAMGAGVPIAYAEPPRPDPGDTHDLGRAPILTEEVAPAAPPAPPVAPPPRRRRRLRRTILIGILAGLLVAGILLALEMLAPRLRGTSPESVPLESRSFSDVGFEISVPEEWGVVREPGGNGRVTFEEAGNADLPGPGRGLGVTRERLSLDAARREAAERAPPDAIGYDEIGIIDGLRVGSLRGFRHLYLSDDEFRDEWWIERGRRTFRLRFWSELRDREQATLLNVRIARTFRVLGG